MLTRRLLPFAALALGACSAAPRDAFAPLQALRRENLKLVIEPDRAGAHSPLANASWEPPQVEGPMVRLRLKRFGLEPALAERLFEGGAGGLFAFACSRDEAQRLRTELARLGEPRVTDLLGPAELTLHSGQRAYLSYASQTAYVGAYELTTTSEGAIADPRIDVALEGVLFDARATLDVAGGPTAVEFELVACDLERPFAQREVRMYSLAPLTVQAPGGLTRRLSMQTALAGDEVLIFGGSSLPVDERGRALVALLEVEPAGERP